MAVQMRIELLAESILKIFNRNQDNSIEPRNKNEKCKRDFIRP